MENIENILSSLAMMCISCYMRKCHLLISRLLNVIICSWHILGVGLIALVGTAQYTSQTFFVVVSVWSCSHRCLSNSDKDATVGLSVLRRLRPIGSKETLHVRIRTCKL